MANLPLILIFANGHIYILNIHASENGIEDHHIAMHRLDNCILTTVSGLKMKFFSQLSVAILFRNMAIYI